MSERNDPERAPDDKSDPLIPLLFQLAGRRPRLAAREVEPARTAARAAWRKQVRRTATRRVVGAAATLAATLLLAVGTRLLGPRPEEPPVPLGTLEVESGSVSAIGLGPQRLLAAGSLLRTSADGRAAVRLATGGSVRVDVSSVVRFIGSSRVSLDRGALYFDSGSGSPPRVGVEVATPLGRVRHLGTQYEARLLDGDDAAGSSGPSALRVRVREGVVLVERGREHHEVRAGTELTMRSEPRVERASVPLHGTSWNWVQRTAPPLAIEGVPLSVFLDWIARETGLPWRYAEAGLREKARRVILHGSIAGLTPEESLSVVLPASGYRYRRAEQTWVLESSPPRPPARRPSR